MSKVFIPSVNVQPATPQSMDLYNSFHVSLDEKRPQGHQHYLQDDGCDSQDGPCHKRCHKSRFRRLLLPIAAVLLTLFALMAVSCYTNIGLDLAGDSLLRRALGDNSGSNGTESTFTKNKLYLIVIFVGLLLVIILAVMLSAWCCKGAFQNPLCCPCYLCACCGGLACLECIGCGLCAEGADEMMG
ncbi:hypothetical protein C8J56DRAFT_979410 [Mycena floridula]|nr:hypothetical protein C8J56DRAFT_994158 [Mycena floridula]KAJ7574339.1 hypothetical protein C8J56DRAFT_979410 [Mycena floridula]